MYNLYMNIRCELCWCGECLSYSTSNAIWPFVYFRSSPVKKKKTLQPAVSHSSFYYVIWVWSHLSPVFKKNWTARNISKQAAMMFTITTVAYTNETSNYSKTVKVQYLSKYTGLRCCFVQHFNIFSIPFNTYSCYCIS